MIHPKRSLLLSIKILKHLLETSWQLMYTQFESNNFFITHFNGEPEMLQEDINKKIFRTV